MINDYIFKVRTDGDILDCEGRVIGHLNLEYIKSIAETPQYEKVCRNCHYFWYSHGYGKCYGQKDAPRVDENEFCKNWKRRE